MKLEVHERIALLGLLPDKADYAGLKALRKAKEIISFNKEEQERYSLHINDKGQWEWDPVAASQTVLDAPMEEYVMDVIREKLADLNSKKELTQDYVSLFEKFIIAYRTVTP